MSSRNLHHSVKASELQSDDPSKPSIGDQPSEAVSEAIARGVASGSYAILVTDHTIASEPVAFVNHAYEVLTGYKLAEIIGLHPHFLTTSDREQVGVKTLEAAFRAGRACSAVLRDYRKNDVPIWYQVSISPVMDKNGKVTHFFGFLRDVTSQIESGETEEETETFIASMAHDLKTPLIGADRMFALIMEGEYGSISPELQDTLVLLSKGNKKALDLVRNLLENYRLRKGARLLHFELVDLPTIVRDAVHEVEVAANTTKSQIEVNIIGEIPQCFFDRLAIGRLLTNLLDNAIKFSPKQSKIQIDVERIGSQIVLKVADNGIGIVSDDKEAIFKKCKRNRKQKYTSGCGLGLYICKEIVKAHCGEISFESILGVGTTFTVVLPIAAGYDKRAAAKSGQFDAANLAVLQ